MASSSSSSSDPSRTWKYDVFPSFSGEDVRGKFLSHLLKKLDSKLITTFKDNDIERSRLIGPALISAIEESRISIVIISKKYASSTWCLDELVAVHKWRFRLLESLSRLVVLAWINLWFSKTYEFSGQLQDSSKELERKKKLCYKTWMFKYKVDEEDQGILQSRTENSLSRREISTYIYQAEALLFESKEPVVSATQEPAIFQSANAHGMITRGKDGSVKTNLRYSLLAVQRIWEKETHDVDITDEYYVLQEEFEQVENHTPCSAVKLERPQDHDALLLPSPGDERFQIKHKWRFKLLLSILELELYLDSLVLITSYVHQFDIISLIILMRVELSVFFSTKSDGFFLSTNLEVKVSLKGEDVIQDKRKRREHVWHVRKKQMVGHVGEVNWLAKKNWNWDREHLKLLNRGKLIWENHRIILCILEFMKLSR